VKKIKNNVVTRNFILTDNFIIDHKFGFLELPPFLINSAQTLQYFLKLPITEGESKKSYSVKFDIHLRITLLNRVRKICDL